MVFHTPALPEEVIRFLAPQEAGEYMIDCTLGEGGHSALFLGRFPDVRITGIDADKEVLEAARERLKEFGGRIEFYRGWAQDFLSRFGTERVSDAPRGTVSPGIILLDLGVSLYHYRQGDRGFSFRSDEPLDMRIDTENGLSAAEILARFSEAEIAGLLFFNAGERHSRRIARAIVEARRKVPVASADMLERIVWDAVPAACRHGRLHPATKTFQALRVAANGEIEKLPGLLQAAFNALRQGGRMGVITYNSLEDRVVKRFFRAAAGFRNGTQADGCRNGFYATPEMPIVKKALLLTPKPALPSKAEVQSNPPSRSAKLRALEKL
ncbi:MAG: 16S rRNA (cytosine(1402)-N(4))-methyltransferase RsmH [Spirochaetaceae bacterium]|jgi:16S rRNA (cytosine1402-N4)-methyltransferase|nr:16S rRNA (cytosine(1402)-N(4))-methyltransferase RsmH [Spirochaetaceae bacterium]